jgi:hypothetical protein
MRCQGLIATAFALTPLGRASIRAAEQCCEKQRHVDAVIPGAIVISAHKESESIPDFLFEICLSAETERSPCFLPIMDVKASGKFKDFAM